MDNISTFYTGTVYDPSTSENIWAQATADLQTDNLNNIFCSTTNAFRNNINGANNIALGLNSLQNNTTGDENIALGENSLQNNTDGRGNVAIGRNTLTSCIKNNYSIAIGNEALRNTVDGGSNIAIGALSLANCNSSRNISFGFNSQGNTTSGQENISLGHRSLQTNTTGSNNIALGAFADTASNNLSNCIVLGANAKAQISGDFCLGSATQPVNVTGTPGAGTEGPAYLQVRLNGNLVYIPYYTSLAVPAP